MMRKSSPRLSVGLWLGGATAVLLLLASAVFTPASLPPVPLCLMYRFTGLPCPGCGLTRAVCCISHGEFAQAWAFNPFGYVLFAGLIALAARPLIAWRWPEAQQRIARWRGWLWVGIGLATLLVASGVWRIARIATQ
ncbi:MAG: DUF2752 domain-containing protein [Verrucomicrobia bacterium]|nr:DUF2752 domain-containing protein [Verrucomicrobiota bacterium]